MYTADSAQEKARTLNPTAVAWYTDDVPEAWRYCIQAEKDGEAKVLCAPSWLEVLERLHDWMTEAKHDEAKSP